MSELDPTSPGSSGSDDPALLVKAKEVFIAVRALGLAERQDAIDLSCGSNPALYELVWSLLRGDAAPLPFESLADDIRAAHHTSGGTAISQSAGTDRIGNYRLLERIGEGGFGIVYAAEQERPVRRRVALKIIKLGMDTRQVVARFEAERQALAMMDHPGIAKVFDAGATPTGRPYFVMEFVKGLPVTQYCDQKKLNLHERLELVIRICEALQHAHQKGVIHRDIKPSNLLVTTIDDKAVPKIIDFGIAKATNARLTDKTIFTEFRQLIGTPEYMSPEQADQAGADVDTRTDVYAVGVLLYELLTGTTPFDSARLRSAAYGELQRIIREEEPPEPSSKLRSLAGTIDSIAALRATQSRTLTLSIRGELDWIVMKALEKDRSRRYETAGALAADIGRYLGGYAVLAGPPGVAYRARKFVRRNRGAVVAGSLLVSALVAGLIGTSIGLVNAEQLRKEAVVERRRADANASEAVEAEILATRRAYSADLMAASSAISAIQFSSARAFLDAAPENLRGWEWRTLRARLDTSIRTVPTEPPGFHFDFSQFFGLRMGHDHKSFFTFDLHGAVVAKQWDVETGRLLHAFEAPFVPARDEYSSLYFTPDGTGLVTLPGRTANPRAELRVDSWSLATGKRISTSNVPWRVDDLYRNSVAYAGGSRLLTYEFGRLSMRAVPSGELIEQQPIEGFPLFSTVFSPDEKLIAEIGSTNNSALLTIRDVGSLKAMFILQGHTGSLTSAMFSSDNHWLVSCADDDTARVWDLSATPPTSLVLPHHSHVWNAVFSPDNALVATIAHDRAIRIWDRASGALQSTYTDDNLIRTPLMFLPDGKTVAGYEADGTVRFWNVRAAETVILRGHTSIVSGARFAKGNSAGIVISSSWDGAGESFGATKSTATLRVWDADTGDEIGARPGRPGDLVRPLAVSDDGHFAAAAILNFDAGRRIRTIPASDAGRIEVIDLSTGRTVCSVSGMRCPHSILFSRDERRLVLIDQSFSGGSLEMHLLDSRTGATLRTKALDPKCDWVFARSPAGDSIAALPLSQDDNQLATRPRTLLLLDSDTLDTVREIDGVPEGQLALGFSPDGRRFATGGADGVLHVFDTQTGEPLATMSGHGAEILAIAFSPDGSRLASAGLDRVIRIWDAKTYEQLAALAGHTGHISMLDWQQLPPGPDHPEGDMRLFSSSGDSTIRVWEPFPIRTRVEAREARGKSLARVQPVVDSLFLSLPDAERVIDRINADSSLSPLDKKTALQCVIARGITAPLEQQAAPNR